MSHKSLLRSLMAALALAAGLAPAWPAPDAATLLKNADAFRAGTANTRIETEVALLDAQGQSTKTRMYSVYVRDTRNSLIVMRSPAEAGQRVLMSGDDFWIVLPNSERPMRITPSQKLLGDASTGDIASMSWSSDYDGSVIGEESCKLDAGERPCIHLSLKANRKGVSYQRIELWVGAERHEPLLADYYVQSERIAKRASFKLDNAAAPKQVTEMVLRDELGDHRITRVKYLDRQQKAVPEAWFNPMFLTRTPNLES